MTLNTGKKKKPPTENSHPLHNTYSWCFAIIRIAQTIIKHFYPQVLPLGVAGFRVQRILRIRKVDISRFFSCVPESFE